MVGKFVRVGLLTVAFTGGSAAAVPESTLLRYHHTVAGVATQLYLPIAGIASYVAGIYDFETQAPDGSFLGYCVDPFQWASASFHAYSEMPLSVHLTEPRYSRVDLLFGHAYAGSLTNAVKAAGFQLALWEVFNDDGNLSTGLVRTTAGTNGAVANEAQALLNALPEWTTSDTSYTPYTLRFYGSDAYQDYIAADSQLPVTVPAIPEPRIVLLMLVGLGFVGSAVVHRRKRT